MLKRLRNLLDTNGLTFRELAVRTFDHVLTEHEILTRASAIAFSAMMAFVPFLALLLTICVQLLPDLSHGGTQSTGVLNLTVEQLEATLQAIFPNEAYKIVEDQIANIQAQPPAAVLSLSLFLTLWTASSLFLEIIDALNRIYGVKESRPFWKLRLTAFFMTMAQIIILFGSMIAIVCWPQIMSALGIGTVEARIVTAIKWVVLFVMILLSFALTFHVGPDALQRHKWVTPGSIFGTVVFLGATYLFRLYVQNFAHYETAYGSLGGVMILLFWFWITSLVLLVAAEMNRIVQYASQKREELKSKEPEADRKQDGTEQ